MGEKIFLLVCEGETDVYVFEALSEYFSNSKIRMTIISLAPQLDATSGTYSRHGFGDVLNWCSANRENMQMLIDFRGASALLMQLDTDIAKQANPDCVDLGYSARHCCEEKLNQHLSVTEEPPRCYYILPTQNTETWILASIESPELDKNGTPIDNYETITDTEDRLIKLGYPSKRGKNRTARRMNKRPAEKYKRYGKKLTDNLDIARRRCAELDRLCGLFELTINENQYRATL